MREKLLRIKYLLDNRVLNGFLIEKKMKMTIYCNIHCTRKIKNDKYFYKATKEFLKEGNYTDLIINDLGDKIYIDKIKE